MKAVSDTFPRRLSATILLIVGCASAAAAGPADEWTSERAAKLWSPMVRPVQHVGVPGYQFQTGVMWDGSLIFGPPPNVPRGDFHPEVKRELVPLGNNQLHLSVAYGHPMRFVDRKGTGNPAIRRGLEDGRLPIVHVETRDGDFLWRETVFAHLLGRKPEDGIDPWPDDVLVTHVRFEARNAGKAAGDAHLWLHFGNTSGVQLGYKCSQGAELGETLPCRFEAPLGIMEDRARYVIPKPARGELVWHDEVPAPEGMKNAVAGAIEWTVRLEPGEKAELRLVIPYGLVERPTAEKLAALDFGRQLDEVRTFWRDLLSRRSRITTPDAFVNDYLAAVAGQMAQQVACRVETGRVWMYKTSPSYYEHLWPCNEGKALPTLDLRGLSHINRPILRTFVDMQTDDVRGLDLGAMGAKKEGQDLRSEGYARVHGFLGNFRGWTANPLLLSHGMGLWALAAHYRITRDREWLGEGKGSPLQAMIDAFDWVSTQRRRTMREQDGKKVPHWGLLPAASAHDWLAGNAIFNDAFCIYGMDELVRLLGEIGHPRAEEMARELNDYRRCLRDRCVEARDRSRTLPLPDGREIPFVPRVVDELDWAKIDWTYTCLGPLRAGAWNAFDPRDELVDQALAFLEAGMPRGQGYYVPIRGNDIADVNWSDISDKTAARHYLWRHYVEYETMWPIGGPLFLARDDLPRFFEWLFNNLAVALHREWRVGVESLDGVPSCAPGDGERWQVIRRMFVNERGGLGGTEQELFLLQAIPRQWIEPGDRLAGEDMATFFGGRADLDVNVAEDGNSVTVAAELDLAVRPAKILLRLRSGDGRPLRSAEINGRKTPILEGDTIRLPDELQGKYRIVGRFD